MSEQADNVTVQAPDPDLFQRVLKTAFELHNTGRHTDAEAMCRVLLLQSPRDSQLQFLLGMVLQKLGRSLEALKHLEQAAALSPQSGRIFNGLGFVHQSLKNHARAVECYSKAIELGRPAADSYYSMGNACYQLGEVERAAAMFQKAVDLKPQDVASWNNLGKCLNDSNRLEAALQAYDRAVAIDPEYSIARYGRAVNLLAAGRLTEGFREYNQWRSHGIKPRVFPQPEWQGEPIPGKTLFLHAEQGFGDAIQYARLVRQTRERAAQVILECRPELKTLFIHSDCAGVVIAYGETIPPFDYFTSLASLPGILGVTLSTIPSQVPYLKAATGWKLPTAPAGRLKVGIVWAGNPSHHNDAARSIRLEELAPLLQVPGVTFYSLQVPIPVRDEAFFRSASGLVDLGGHFNGFLDTAAAVAEMDLVITVDTGVGHLAGALAKPIWTLIPYAPDWRWMTERQDTPWYPTMRLFRQAQRHQWLPVISRLTEELRRYSSRKKDSQPERPG